MSNSLREEFTRKFTKKSILSRVVGAKSIFCTRMSKGKMSKGKGRQEPQTDGYATPENDSEDNSTVPCHGEDSNSAAGGSFRDMFNTDATPTKSQRTESNEIPGHLLQTFQGRVEAKEELDAWLWDTRKVRLVSLYSAQSGSTYGCCNNKHCCSWSVRLTHHMTAKKQGFSFNFKATQQHDAVNCNPVEHRA